MVQDNYSVNTIMYGSNLGLGIGSDRSREPENGVFMLRRLLGPCRTLKGWTLKPGRTGGIKDRGPDPILQKTFSIRL